MIAVADGSARVFTSPKRSVIATFGIDRKHGGLVAIVGSSPRHFPMMYGTPLADHDIEQAISYVIEGTRFTRG